MKIVIDKKTIFALAFNIRIEILKKLNERRMTLTELSKSLNMAKTTVREHLDKLVEAELVRRVDEGRKWIYYELTEKGRKILYPNDLTRIILLLSALACMLPGSFEVFRFLTIKPTPIPARTPAPAPIRPHVPVQTSPEIHLLVGLTSIAIGLILIYFVMSDSP